MKSKKNKPTRATRRQFIRGIAGIAACGMIHPAGVFARTYQEHLRSAQGNSFTRIFYLPPFAEPGSAVERALIDMGAPGGLLDAKDPLREGPIRLITNPELSPNNTDSTANTAGITFLGQFLDHDMTFDGTSRLGVPTSPEDSTNSRTPALDLDSVYGGGPTVSPQLYDPRDRAKFKVESNGQFEDLPRGSDGAAIIADPRNDENLMIAGLQVAFLLFHNKVVDKLRTEGFDRRRELDWDQREWERDDRRHLGVFAEARRLVTWHYQWIIVNEFLPHIIGARLVNDILSQGPRYYRPRRGEQSMPVEFQGAAYRFGHSLVRP
jgi:hypothetical protein